MNFEKLKKFEEDEIERLIETEAKHLTDDKVIENLKGRGYGDSVVKDPVKNRELLKSLMKTEKIINAEVDKLTNAEVIEELKKRNFGDFVYSGEEKNREFLKYVRLKGTDNITFCRERIRNKKKEEEKERADTYFPPKDVRIY